MTKRQLEKQIEVLEHKHRELNIHFNYLLEILGIIIARNIKGDLFFVPVKGLKKKQKGIHFGSSPKLRQISPLIGDATKGLNKTYKLKGINAS